jgi:hypothetical protein
MKQYVIDELRPKDYEMVKAFMDENFGSSNVDGVYWIQLDQNILTQVQKEHTECQHATEKQRNWIIELADSIFDKLGIKT